MSNEQEPPLPRLSAIRFDYDQARVIVEAEGKPVAQIPFPVAGVIFQAPYQVVDAQPLPEPSPAAAELPAEVVESVLTDGPQRKEREKTLTLTGRLKSNVQEGKPDRSGKPTAYARFAAHVEGEREAHDYLTTFHRHTAKIALGLPANSQMTVEGYAHPSGSEKRLDTLSVINIVQWPGKPAPRRQK